MPSKFEFGYESDDSYYIRHMTDGTTTLVQIIYRDPSSMIGGPQLIGHGIARRRKGETRNPGLGSALAFMRAHAEAYEYYKSAAENAEHGTLTQQMERTEAKVLAEARKKAARHRKDVRRRQARELYERIVKGRPNG
jgi:hypothetical protein